MNRTFDPQDPEYVPADEEAASLAGLALAPWVAEQAAPIRAAHLAARRGESKACTSTKVARWRRGDYGPQGGRT